MLNRIDLRGGARDPRRLLPRAQLDVSVAVERIRPLVEAVRDHGYPAIREASERFDGVSPERLRVPVETIRAAEGELDPQVRAALLESITRARKVHDDQRRTDHTTTVVPGGTVTERWVPVDRVGLYVPGGLAMYPSTVVMNVVPAQAAGVRSLVVVSPPQKDNDGLPDRRVLAACALLGVDEVYAVGGAQAVAMLAYGAGVDPAGDERCEPVDMITGPGNIWVTAAKRLLRGVVGIDAEAGPTEIAILADDTADPAHVAADLISQAEHDPLAASVLVTPSTALADAVDAELARQAPAAKHAERIGTALRGEQSGVVLVDDLEAGLRVVDAYAAEHLEIQTENAREWALRVRNAGAVFVGAWSPVSLGDYCAGSNHVLPTGGCARHSSGLSVQSFLRGVHLIEYTQEALRDVAPHVVTLATVEDLPAHGQAVSVRFPEGGAS
ncbi:histidinol dehydrogenase [Micromonospora tulbaghiae]|uniref:Histidinol dehydrogenase n=1 Tax=Micromonospora tulbaghiae TaxID=479978 RepID=A0AAW4JNR2_9ACTN|nr:MULTISPECIES: histidinol dehydrogenase [Micromonospora]KAB1907884.1 histidinol dehydrogenase [Micromonospora sp. AMSO1212t]MBO4140577.1 histidinol dehydrogenase [Micromonospora tulbaghiae]MDX5457799.1 histidinol dehydrogenase [Micromonospora tulbaghiae]SCE88301.1 histidinol dehydrogenase [Micromonospora tulbaghiae]